MLNLGWAALTLMIGTIAMAGCQMCKSKVLCRNSIPQHGMFAYVSSPVLTAQVMFPDVNLRIGSNISSSYTLCLIECAKTMNCKSFNLISNSTCQLLKVDIFANKSLIKQETSSDHYNLPHSCSSSPCKNSGTCLANYDDDTYTCSCQRGYRGRFCEEFDYERMARIYLDFNKNIENRGWESSLKYAHGTGTFSVVPDRLSTVYYCPAGTSDCIQQTSLKVPNCLEFPFETYNVICPAGLTFSFWTKYNPYKNNRGTPHSIFSRIGRGLYLRLHPSNSLSATMILNLRNLSCMTSSLPRLVPQTWTQIAVSYDVYVPVIYIYVNGELCCRGTDELGFGETLESAMTFSSDMVDKYLDNVALYQMVLSREQLWSLYSHESDKRLCIQMEGTYLLGAIELDIKLDKTGFRGKWSNGRSDATGYFTGLCQGVVTFPDQGKYIFEYDQISCRLFLYWKIVEDTNVKKKTCGPEVGTICEYVAGVYTNPSGPVFNISFSYGEVRGMWDDGKPEFSGFVNHKCEGLAYLPHTGRKWSFFYDAVTCHFSWTQVEEGSHFSKASCRNASVSDLSKTTVYTAYSCQNLGDILLWCNVGVIKVIMANFGRTDAQRCLQKKFYVTNCLSPTSLPKMKSRCDGQKTCSLPAVVNLWGDPCPESYKFLESTWSCVSYG